MKKNKGMEDYRKEILANHVRESSKLLKFYREQYGNSAHITYWQWVIYSTYEKLYFELYHETVN